MIHICRGMLFKAVMRLVIFNCPVGFRISGKLKRFAVFIEVTLRSLFLFRLLFSVPLGDGGNPSPLGEEKVIIVALCDFTNLEHILRRI